MVQQAYPSLQEMYSGNPLEQMYEGQRRSQITDQFNQQGLADMVAKRAEESAYNSQRTAYEQQRARQTQLESDLLEKAQPLKLKEQERKFQATADEDQAKGLERFGNMIMQVGTLAKNNGGSIPLSMSSKLPPDLLQMLQEHGPDKLISMGQGIYQNSKGYLGQDQKNAGAAGVAGIKADSAEAIQGVKAELERYKADARSRSASEANAMRERVARIMANSKASSKQKDDAYKTLDQAFNAYTAKASEATSPEEKAFYSNLAQETVNQKTAYIQAQGVAKQAGGIDSGAVSGLPTVPTTPARTVNPPSRTPAVKKDAQGRILLD